MGFIMQCNQCNPGIIDCDDSSFCENDNIIDTKNCHRRKNFHNMFVRFVSNEGFPGFDPSWIIKYRSNVYPNNHHLNNDVKSEAP